MKILIYIFLNIFISQIVVCNLQSLNNDVIEKIAFDFQEENEDDSEESENEKTEEKSNDKEKNKDFSINHNSDIKSKIIASYYSQNNYPSVFLKTPFNPPELNT